MSLFIGGSQYNNYQTLPQLGKKSYVSTGVSKQFASSVFDCAERLKNISDVTRKAMAEIESIIILEDKNSKLPSEYASTEDKFINYASDSYGFVSRDDDAIVIVEDNHRRKNIFLEGSLSSQAADTFAHEVGHIIDKNLSTTPEFREAFLKDLKNIHSMLNDPDSQIQGENLRESLFYLKHYVDGVNFEDGISEDDITRTGLRENFAECFSTLVDTNPTKINTIFAQLFVNTMAKTRELVV